MKILVKHRSIHPGTIQKHYPNAAIIDVTSKGPEPWVRFSPFYPHGGIPIPQSDAATSQSVEGIWQGLKVFENQDIDIEKFENNTMKRLKRTIQRFGKVRGHRFGIQNEQLLDYKNARINIYLPSYRWILDNCLQKEVQLLKEISQKQDILLLDYETNTSVGNVSKPLSHAGLLRLYLMDAWPNETKVG